MGSLLGSRQTSHQSSDASGQGSSQSVQASNSQQTSSSVQGSQSSSFSKAGLTADQVLSGWQSGAGSEYSKSAALSDVNGALKSQALDALQSVMPSINKSEQSAGAYNSTTKQLLTDDATARIAGQLAQTGINAITAYGQISNQNLSAMSGVARDTGSSGSSGSSFGNSTSQGTSSSVGASQSQYDQNSTSSGGSRGGSGLMGLFADGGTVDDTNAGDSALNTFLDVSGINGAINEVRDTFRKANQLQTDPAGFVKDYLAGQVKQAGKQLSNDMKFANGGMVPKKMMGMYADGGSVDSFPQSPLPQMPVININVGNGASPTPAKDEADNAVDSAADNAASSMADQIVSALFADGGQVPSMEDDDSPEELLKDYTMRGQATQKPVNTLPPATELLAAMQRYKNGGMVRSGEADVQSGGKIRGPQSPTGEDNQVIGVAGGEGILPKDVMQVPGVADMVQQLIQKYHTPIATK